jgi:hypothetical protein
MPQYTVTEILKRNNTQIKEVKFIHHNLYSTPSIIRIIKPRRMRWAGHVARMRRSGMHIDIGGKVTWKDQGVGGWTIFKWILLRDRMGRCGLDRSGSGKGPVKGSTEFLVLPKCISCQFKINVYSTYQRQCA